MTIEITDIENIYIELPFSWDAYFSYQPAAPYYIPEESGQDATVWGTHDTSAPTNQDNSTPAEIIGLAQQWSNPQNQDYAY